MSRKGNCLDNAGVENFLSHLKTECVYMYKFETVEEMKQAISQYMKFYNNERIQN
ncbi:hypothetical protein LH47_02687 [Anoxybacillus thermarum]|jgi:putative transposase|uniref:Integrase catalytic domain-containing protein n=1 Tax=Anoxybacillus thermarum TaxID=404937 RepID=A0A0D0Q5D2_9BACL|nr:hypothetical protein LH47_02687 [Anoxybacillus thermarum]